MEKEKTKKEVSIFDDDYEEKIEDLEETIEDIVEEKIEDTEEKEIVEEDTKEKDIDKEEPSEEKNEEVVEEKEVEEKLDESVEEKNEKKKKEKDESEELKDKKSKKKDENEEDEDDEDDDEESAALGIKIVLALVVLAIIIALVVRSFNGSTAEYTVTFDTNGGTKISYVVVDENSKVNEPIKPSKDGYEFVGWYYNDEVYDFNTKVTGDITLEARWVQLETAPASGVDLDQGNIELGLNSSVTLIATVRPENAVDKTVTWESSDSSVATVDENGKVSAVKEGTAVITVKTNDGGFTSTAKVTVSNDIIRTTGVTLNQSKLNLTTNSTATLKASVKPANASNSGVIWTSSNINVATVSASGVVTAKADGEATITVTTKDGSFKASCMVIVESVKVTGITLSTTELTLEVGAKKRVNAIIAPADATNKSVTWKSENTNIAVVSSSGDIVGVSEGETKVTATTKDGNKIATVKVIVQKKNVPVAQSLDITGEKTVVVGNSINLSATINPAGVQDTVTWKSSDPNVATVDEKTGQVKGVTAGNVTITATTSNGVQATHNVVVSAPASENIDSNEIDSNGDTE